LRITIIDNSNHAEVRDIAGRRVFVERLMSRASDEMMMAGMGTSLSASGVGDNDGYLFVSQNAGDYF
jgi:hypothetical protein